MITDGGTELKILQNKGNIEYSLASLSTTILMVSVNGVNKMILLYLPLSVFFVFVIVFVFVFVFVLTCSRERVRGMRVFAVELLQVGQAKKLLVDKYSSIQGCGLGYAIYEDTQTKSIFAFIAVLVYHFHFLRPIC